MNSFFLLGADDNPPRTNRKFNAPPLEETDQGYFNEAPLRRFRMNIPSSPGTKHENIYPRSVPDNDNGELIIDKESIDRLLNMDSSSKRRLSPAKIQRLVHRLDSLRPLAQDGIISLQGAVLKVSSPEYPSIARSVQGINRTLRTIGLPNAAHLLRALFAGPEQDGDV